MTEGKMKGLSVSVFRNAEYGDCSNDGISSTHGTVILVGEGLPEIFEVSEERPALKLVKRHIGGRLYLHVEPLERPKNVVGPMFGGNFVYTSDGRFPSPYPIPIHDRFETAEAYDRNFG